jgi:uncharacterized membrane protein
MLVSFPIAFYTATLASYLAYQIKGDILWFQIGVVANIAGVVMAAVAAIPGTIDWAIAIAENTHAKRAGLIHMGFNVLSLVCFAFAAFINYGKWGQSFPNLGATLLLSGVGVISTVTAGFFGWTMVQKYHVGVDLTSAQAVIEPTEKLKVFSSGPQTVPSRRK